MATGAVKSALTSTATTAYLAIQPAAGEEWVVHNVHHEADAELYFYDGTNQILVASDTVQGSWLGLQLHVTNSRYYRVKNTNASTKLLGYDGVQTV